MISRRWFLIGTGAFLTSSFVADAEACIAETGAPLLVPPPRAHQTLFAYPDMGGEDGTGILLTLGEYTFDAPPAPTWLEYLRGEGHELTRLSHFRKIGAELGLSPTDLRHPLDDYDWESIWEDRFGPTALAYRTLDPIVRSSRRSRLQRAGLLRFHDSPNPHSSSRWVEARDELTVSLLQAHLRELDAGIAVEWAA